MKSLIQIEATYAFQADDHPTRHVGIRKESKTEYDKEDCSSSVRYFRRDASLRLDEDFSISC